MGNEWKDRGSAENIGGQLLNNVTGGVLGENRTVENTSTGETKEIFVGWGQSAGEAIEKGQFVEE
jgi:hypothetical protein